MPILYVLLIWTPQQNVVVTNGYRHAFDTEECTALQEINGLVMSSAICKRRNSGHGGGLDIKCQTLQYMDTRLIVNLALHSDQYSQAIVTKINHRPVIKRIHHRQERQLLLLGWVVTKDMSDVQRLVNTNSPQVMLCSAAEQTNKSNAKQSAIRWS